MKFLALHPSTLNNNKLPWPNIANLLVIPHPVRGGSLPESYPVALIAWTTHQKP